MIKKMIFVSAVIGLFVTSLVIGMLGRLSYIQAASCDSTPMTSAALMDSAVNQYSATVKASSSVTPKAPKLDAEQTRNAKTIIAIGKKRGLSDRDIKIALMTAAQESGIRNLNYGDRCSLGVFQQQWCLKNKATGKPVWGTRAQVTNVTYATNRFFEGLEAVKNRNSMSLTQAAQAVQHSAYPNAYAKHEPLARAILAAYGDAVVVDDPSAGIISAGCTMGILAVDAAVEAAESKVGSKPGTPDGKNPAGTSLVTWAYRTAGIAVDTNAATQLRDGVGVEDRRDLARGDLLYYGSGKRANRVAMYVGDDTIISVDAKGVARKIPLTYKRYIGAVRPVPVPYRAIAIGYGTDGSLAAAGSWTVPIQGSYRVSSPYGPRKIIKTPNGSTKNAYHDGVDLAAPAGRPILAAAGGKIVAMKRLSTSYGWHIIIDHGDGITTLYAHMSGFARGLSVGNTVTAGQIIGKVGSTGNSTGNHLHFSVRVDGKHVEPVRFMKNHGVGIG